MIGLSLVPGATAAPREGRLPATEISRIVSLDEAAKAGIVELTSKGSFAGDVMQVDLQGKPHFFPAKPVVITVRVEFFEVGKPLTVERLQSLHATIQRVEDHLNGLKMKAEDGTPITVDIVPLMRAADASPTPEFHQVQIDSKASRTLFRVHLNALGYPETPNVFFNAADGVWVPGQFSGEPDPTVRQNKATATWAHEIMHLAGLRDEYVDRIATSDEVVP